MRTVSRLRALLLSLLVGAACVPPVTEPVPAYDASSFAFVGEDYAVRAQELIDGAEDELLVVQFEIIVGASIEPLVAGLEAAAARGVAVSVLVDEEVASSSAAVTRLQEAGVHASFDGEEVRTHAKLLVADGARALVGSTNWADSAVLRNRERDLWVEGGAVAEQLARYATSLMEEPEEDVSIPLAPGQVNQRPVLDRDLGGVVQELVDGASERVGLMLYGFRLYPNDPTSPSTEAALALGAAASRGARVQVILEAGSNGTLRSFNEQAEAYLEARGVEVRWEEPDRITHAKVLLVDERALVGSANWGYGGFSLYHEASVLADDPAAVGPLWEDFETLWDTATDVHP